MGKTCPNCQSSEFDVDPARGDTVCTSCGIVVEENAIVSEVTIQENSDGSSSVVGQFVSSEGSYNPYLSGFQYGLKKESREITLNKGKQEIRELAGMLNLNRHCVDTAFNFFKMAIGKQLSRGRRIKHIVAACVYMTCRTEATPHLLLDFSDITQVNVFTLGKTFLTLAKELHINLPVLDPCIYITRFAHRLDFGDKTHDVSMTAMRLVSRMKRDWLHTGRRPSGLCGAALLVAARLHGYSCTLHDIVRVVKIGHDTIRKRLIEFECTPSSKLTINEFMEIDLEAEHDPPAFTNSKIKAKIQQLESEAGGMTSIENEIGKISSAIDIQLVKETELKSKKKVKRSSAEPAPSVQVTEELPIETADDDDMKAAADFVHSENPLQVADKILQNKNPSKESVPTDFGPSPTAASLGLNNSVNECMSVPSTKIQGPSPTDGQLDIADIDDEEIDNLILSPQECAIKTRIWMIENGEFIKELEEKRELRRQENEKKAKPRPRKNKTISRKDYYGASRTAGEAIEKLMTRQKLSNKINYEALKRVNEEDEKEIQPILPASPLILGELPSKSSTKRKLSTSDVIPVKSVKAETVGFLDLDKPVMSPSKMAVVEESHDIPPLAEEEYDDAEDEEEEDEDQSCMSVSQLLLHSGVANGGYGGDADDMYDYD